MAALLRQPASEDPEEEVGNPSAESLRLELHEARARQAGVRGALWAADLVFLGIAVVIMLKRRPGPGEIEFWVCTAALAVGAWLSFLAVRLRG
jgi:hypothetical protein